MSEVIAIFFLLESFFKMKIDFLQSIIDNPSRWLEDNVAATHEISSLDGKEWDQWSLDVLDAIQKNKTTLPDLEDAIIAFVQGARETFVDRFSDEFKEGNGINELTETERSKLYFASTNDVNEGGLGSWRRGQERRPAETLHKFNTGFKATQNNTKQFIQHKLTQDADDVYLMRSARRLDASGLHQQRKIAQMIADEAKAVENKGKETKREVRRGNRAATLLETSRNLVLDDAEINRLNNDELNRQLDYHRDAKKTLEGVIDAEKVPFKSHMKYKEDRHAELKKAAARYITRSAGDTGRVTGNPSQAVPVVVQTDDEQYLSDYNDDLI